MKQQYIVPMTPKPLEIISDASKQLPHFKVLDTLAKFSLDGDKNTSTYLLSDQMQTYRFSTFEVNSSPNYGILSNSCTGELELYTIDPQALAFINSRPLHQLHTDLLSYQDPLFRPLLLRGMSEEPKITPMLNPILAIKSKNGGQVLEKQTLGIEITPQEANNQRKLERVLLQFTSWHQTMKICQKELKF